MSNSSYSPQRSSQSAAASPQSAPKFAVTSPKHASAPSAAPESQLLTSETAPAVSISEPTPLVVASGKPVTFADLPLCEPLHRALKEKNYDLPSPIQAQAIPHLLNGRDMIGLAQTGTGKTAAFSLPMLHRLAANPKAAHPKRCRALILTPTRELAVQIAASIAAYGKHLRLTHALVFGGVAQGPQVRALSRGVDIVIATPGRLMDLENQRHLSFDAVEIFVLDEADRMLDLGFVHEVKKIVAKLPAKRQALLFSATMPPTIQEIVRTLTHHPVRVEVSPVSSTVERIDQKVAFVERNDKHKLLLNVLENHPEGLVLIFVRMKHGANRLVEQLGQDKIRAEAIHGNKSQGARQRALENFRSGKSRIMVATDIAARGIDIKGITLVINYDLPEEPESYVHRIGRTARAGAEGQAIAFCDRAERYLLRNIERVIRQTIPAWKDHPFVNSKPDLSGNSSFDASSRGPRREARPYRGSGIGRNANGSRAQGGGPSGGQGGGDFRGPRPDGFRSRSR